MRDQAVYLCLDGSISTAKINLKGDIVAQNHPQQILLDSGPESIWGDLTPQIHYPLPYPVNEEKTSYYLRNANLRLFVLLVTGPIIYFILLKVFKFRKQEPMTES